MLSKISDAILYAIVIAFVINLHVYLINWLIQQRVPTEGTNFLAMVSGVVAIAGFAWLTERLIPLRSISYERWVYNDRPKKKVHPYGMHTVLQVVLSIYVGGIVGLSLGQIVLFPCLSVALRIIVAFRLTTRLPDLLDAGRTTEIGTSPWNILDSELVSGAFASSWLRNKRQRNEPSGNLYILFLRRLKRRSYLLVIAVIILSITITLAWPLKVPGILFFVFSWSILGAGFQRCADFSALCPSLRLKLWVHSVYSLSAVLTVWLLWGLNHATIMIPLIIICVCFVSHFRSKPRRVDSLTSLDSGVGIAFSPEIIAYFGKGLFLPSLCVFFIVVGML